MSRFVSLLILLTTAASLSGCGIQAIPKAENEIEAQTAEVTNQYKRRADMIPQLVATVKGYATHEEATLEGVIEARAKASQVTIDPSKSTPEQLAAYQKAQGQLSQALGRLMVVSEKYPDLKADQNFRDLQAQIEGTENRIGLARKRLIDSIKEFNNLVTVFPTSLTNSLFLHKDKKAQWDLGADEKATSEKAPEIKF